MKNLRMLACVSAGLAAAIAAHAQTLDWPAVEKLAPRTWISVTTNVRTYCEFQSATNEKLFCQLNSDDLFLTIADPLNRRRGAYKTFNRGDIRGVHVEAYDSSSGPLALMLAAGGGGGLDSNGQPTSFAGIKIGGPFSVDLQYDRIQAHSGFSTEGSAVIPLFRVPRFRADKQIKFVKVFAEPGVGYRAGDGAFGGYSSAKVMAVLLTDTWSDNWTAPYVEFQRRFPFESPLEGDNRLTIGVMLALCNHCGLN
jgi:hypothetical protein